MAKYIVTTLVGALVCVFTTKAQVIISQFTWENNPVTQADIGPNGTSVSGSATSDVNGVGGTNGLNPGLPKADINMDIQGSPTFDVAGIDISIDFQRDESRGDFIKRGNNLVFGMNGGNLSVTFRVDDGAGSYVNINSGNVYSIPYDNTFRTYRFFYLPDTGVAELRVDGTTVWSYSGTPNRDLYWNGAGDLRVGHAMDGSGNDRTVFDNLVIASVTNSALPVSMTSYDIEPTSDGEVTLTWQTASEQNSDYFQILRSRDGASFSVIGRVEGAGNSSQTMHYDFKDTDPFSGISYYRIKQVDFDGASKMYSVLSITVDGPSDIAVYPNPIGDNQMLTIATGEDNFDRLLIFTTGGQLVYKDRVVDQSQITINAPALLKSGVYLVRLVKNKGKSVTKKIVRQ